MILCEVRIHCKKIIFIWMQLSVVDTLSFRDIGLFWCSIAWFPMSISQRAENSNGSTLLYFNHTTIKTFYYLNFSNQVYIVTALWKIILFTLPHLHFHYQEEANMYSHSKNISTKVSFLLYFLYWRLWFNYNILPFFCHHILIYTHSHSFSYL